ncbi:hypothetical protein HGRIS_013760 [Hohenbuehelia grisea]|uniref:F-box domain-containing protein n=1 Tax=Hohenbuehelia grisea TaxID=104357 RepID=A0ABR3IWP3_9AGAR
MSAKGHLRRTASLNLPHLPTELWIKILHSAIESQDEEADLKRLRYNIRLSELDKPLRKSLAAGTRIVRVCQQWAAIATPFLYETVFITRKRDLSSLVFTLEKTKVMASKNRTERLPFGTFVKRLVFIRADNRYVLDHKLLARLILCMPNLEAAHFWGLQTSFRIAGSFPDSIREALQTTCAQSLRLLNIEYPTTMDVGNWRQFVLNMPNLCRVQSVVMYEDLGRECSTALPPMPNLQMLHLHSAEAEFYRDDDGVRFPALRELTWTPIFLDPDVATFLSRYGSRVTRINLTVEAQAIHEDVLTSNLQPIALHCNNLTQLTLQFEDWESIAYVMQTLCIVIPPVKRITLRCEQLQASSKVYRHLSDALIGYKFPASLRAIQFIEGRGLVDFRYCHPRIFAQLVQGLGSKQIEVQDAFGESIQG